VAISKRWHYVLSVGSPHPDDTTTFATHASSLYQHASLQEEKDRLSKLIATINQVITYLALNLPNPQDSSSLASQPHPFRSGDCFQYQHAEEGSGDLGPLYVHLYGNLNRANEIAEHIIRADFVT